MAFFHNVSLSIVNLQYKHFVPYCALKFVYFNKLVCFLPKSTAGRPSTRHNEGLGAGLKIFLADTYTYKFLWRSGGWSEWYQYIHMEQLNLQTFQIHWWLASAYPVMIRFSRSYDDWLQHILWWLASADPVMIGFSRSCDDWLQQVQKCNTSASSYFTVSVVIKATASYA